MTRCFHKVEMRPDNCDTSAGETVTMLGATWQHNSANLNGRANRPQMSYSYTVDNRQ